MKNSIAVKNYIDSRIVNHPRQKKLHAFSFIFPPEKPILTEEPTDVEITFGGTVYFTCKAEGDPEPDIVWLYNKLAITIIHLDGRVGIFLIYFLQFSNEISPDDDPKYQVLQDGTLMIENASDSDMGSYECMAKSPAGEVKSRSVHMKPMNVSNSTKGNIIRQYHSTWTCCLQTKSCVCAQ